MRFSLAPSLFTLFCLAAATTQAAVLAPARPTRIARKEDSVLQPRAKNPQIVSAIYNHKDGRSVCSSFLSISPYAATKTSVIIKTVTRTVPAVTTTAQVTITNTADSTVTVVNTEVDVSSVTPTEYVTVTASSSASAAARRRAGSPQALPDWLSQYSAPQVSEACSKVVVPRTKTVRTTSTTTATAQSTVAVFQTSTVVVTPTITSVTTVQSTETEPAVTSTIVVVPPPPTTLPSTSQARIKLINIADGSLAGYWSASVNEYGIFEPSDVSGALVVEVPTAGSTFNLAAGAAALNGDVAYLGSIAPSGSSYDMSSAIPSNFLYTGVVPIGTAGVQQASPDTSLVRAYGAGSELTYESQIWNYNVDTKELSMAWTNSDGSTFVPVLGISRDFLYWFSDVPYYSYTPVQAFLEPL